MSMTDAGPRKLTDAAPLRRIVMIINPASGSTGPESPAEARAIFDQLGVEAEIVAPEPSGLVDALKAALAQTPDLLIVLAGDGTARTAAELSGADGPLLAPLPGGTMNILPHALYGARTWQEALVDSLTSGVVRPVSAGEIDGRPFFVAAILGDPALWARAREAVRKLDLRRALARARLALNRSLASRRIRFALDGKPHRRAEALVLTCPMISKAMVEETALEVAAIDPTDAGEAVRVGLRAMMIPLNERIPIGESVVGAWRDDAAVRMDQCLDAHVWSRQSIPALLDGEPTPIGSDVEIRFRRVGFRALVPADQAGGAA